MKHIIIPGLTALSFVMMSCSVPRSTLLEVTDKYSVRPLHEVNTDSDELAPVSTEAGLYLASDRSVGDDEEYRLYLGPSVTSADARAALVQIDGGNLRSGAMHVTGRQVIFGQCYREGGIGDCDLYSGTLSSDGASITDVRILPPPLNDIEWDHHPAVSPDGRLLVFASERLGGIGGSDLWYSRSDGGGWSQPVLMSEIINTSDNEMTPSFSADGGTLYFASDGREGYGGFDLYASEFAAGTWTAPKLLPAPFNSGDDDLFLCGGPGADVSFVSSDRAGSKDGYNIFRIEKQAAPAAPPPPPPPPVKRELVLRVFAENAFTRERIPAMITIVDASNEKQLAEGKGFAETALDESKSFSVTASHPGFMSALEEVTVNVLDGAAYGAVQEGQKDVVQRVMFLTPITEEERKIFAFTVEFDFDLSDIRPEEERKLDSAAILLELFPQSTVVASGHTDSLGTDAYNIKLGYNRATEVSRYVATYLRGKNVKLRNPMEIRTYGETQPRDTNMTDEGRQRNRRVEIAIIRNR